MGKPRQKVFISDHAIDRFLEIHPHVPRKNACAILRGMYHSGITYGAQLGKDFSLLTQKKRSRTKVVLMCTKDHNGNVVVKTVMPKDMAKNNMYARDMRIHKKK